MTNWRRLKIFKWCGGLILLVSVGPHLVQAQETYTNELVHESSPYLLQHAHNPVNWYPWGEKALEKAQKEDKMLLISVGYAACHWCHVMEHESFEDTAVARIMNEHFVCIKVDREERPDVDQIYMNAAQLISGSGGWPLNAFALSDGRPFFAGTYYEKDQWKKVLQYFINMYAEDRPKMVDQAQKVTEGIASTGTIELISDYSGVTMNDAQTAFTSVVPLVDKEKGGRSGDPKFPLPSVWEYVLQHAQLTGDENAFAMVKTTLDHIARGGIYDQIGGGFARYSTDEDWHVPHFEKMLYDNAQLVSMYAHAYRQTKDPLYKKVVYETLEFVQRELTAPDGGFYSSLDADSEGEEGTFYVWTAEELNALLGDQAKLIMDYYKCSERGNWENGKNVLYRTESNQAFAVNYELTEQVLQAIVEDANTALWVARSKRERPKLDDKQLTAWNALMLKGYVDAFRAFGEPSFLEAALNNAQFIQKNTVGKDGELTRNYKDGISSIPAFLDDYALVISAFTDLYQATFDEQWLMQANELTSYAIDHFYDSVSGMFFYTHANHTSLISRKIESSDNVIPSSNSVMAENLFQLGHYFYNTDYLEKSEQMVMNVQNQISENAYYYSNWARLQLMLIQPPYEVAIVGQDLHALRAELDQDYHPFVLLLGADKKSELTLLEGKFIKGQTTIFVCQNKACQAPVTSVSEALTQMKF